MKPLGEVRDTILGSVPRLGAERVPLDRAPGRILAETVTAPQDVPHFANSAMDGFAVRASDIEETGADLEMVGEVAAGTSTETELGPGQAMRIMTGAPMPPGADAVVRVEDTEESGGRVKIAVAVSRGTHVRLPGGDITTGEEVFPAGTRLFAPHIGVLATIGVTEMVVSTKPKLAVMSTGDELAEPATEELAAGMIRDSNRPMLLALAAEAGVDTVDLGRLPDEADSLRAAVGTAVAKADAVVTSGGVSMGEYDLIKTVLSEETGIDMLQVAMKPGKPFGFGMLGSVPFFGLPGNPVSVLVSFEQFVRPALLTMQGATAVLRPRVAGRAGERFSSDPAKEEFVRARLSEEATVVRAGGQGSHVLSGAARADFLAVVPVGVEVVEPGEEITLELFRAEASREAGR